MDLSKLTSLASDLGSLLVSKKFFFTSAESCTGGWLGQSVTSVQGSSFWFSYGFITYSNTSKINLLKVSKNTLEKFGAVSEEVVKEMVVGALKKSGADIGVAISGIAGPNGGSKDKPVGTVCLAWALKDDFIVSSTQLFDGNREQVRYHSVEKALLGAIDLLMKL